MSESWWTSKTRVGRTLLSDNGCTKDAAEPLTTFFVPKTVWKKSWSTSAKTRYGEA